MLHCIKFRQKKGCNMPLDRVTVNEWFDYDNGIVRWKKDPYRSPNSIGAEAGSLMHSGYRYIYSRKLGPSPIATHRVVWTMFNDTPPKGFHVDHINQDKLDNRIENLRILTVSHNVINSRIGKNNTSGVTGVSYLPNMGKWRARIMLNRKDVHLGTFGTKEEAIAAREEAISKVFR